MKNAFSNECLENVKVICFLAFIVGRIVALGPSVRWQTRWDFWEHLPKSLLVSVSWLWFDFHVLFLWDTSKLDIVEREWGHISLCGRSCIPLQWWMLFHLPQKETWMKVILRVRPPWLWCWPPVGLWFYLCTWRTYSRFKRNQQGMHADKRLCGCPKLLLVRGVEIFTLLTAGQLELLQGRKGSKA